MAGNEILGGIGHSLLYYALRVNHSFTQLVSTEAGPAIYQADRKEKDTVQDSPRSGVH